MSLIRLVYALWSASASSLVKQSPGLKLGELWPYSRSIVMFPAEVALPNVNWQLACY